MAKSTYHDDIETMTRPGGDDWLGDAVEEKFGAEHCNRVYRVEPDERTPPSRMFTRQIE